MWKKAGFILSDEYTQDPIHVIVLNCRNRIQVEYIDFFIDEVVFL